jgi:PAS domain S-box-containing protein
LTLGFRIALARVLAVSLDQPRTRSLIAAIAAVGLEVGLHVPVADWPGGQPVVATATGVAIVVASAAFGGALAGLIAALAGWTLNFFFVADESLDALLALPAWLVAGFAVGWLAALLWSTAQERSRAERQLAAVRGVAAEAVVSMDSGGAVAGWSPSAEAMYGYSSDEIVGRPLTDLFAGPDADEQAERFLAAVEQGAEIVAEQAVHRRQDDTKLSVSVSAVSTGREREAVLVVQDVSEVGIVNERLRELEAKYRSLTEHLPVVTYVRPAEPEAAPVFVSPQVDRLLGYTMDEWLGDPELFLRLIHPDDRDRVVEGLSAVPDPARPRRSEYRMVSRDGRIVWVRDEAAVVLDAHGQPLCVQGYLLDVSERKTADEDRKQLRAAEVTATAKARDRQRKIDFVATAASVLASSLDYKKTLKEVAGLAVRDLASWCVVDLLEEDGRVKRLVAERAEPSPASPKLGPEPEPEVVAVIREQRPTVSESRISLPLVTRGRRVAGALTLVAGEDGRTYTSDDLSWALAVAGMAALVIDNARLYDEVEARADAARVLTYVGDGVSLLDRAGVVRLWNPSAETITGLPADTVLGEPAAQVIPGWDRISERVPIAVTREKARAEALPLETERGERWISISGVEFFGGTVYAFRDITEAHRLDELQAEFIATASHELRTPLAAVYGAAQTLRRHDFALDEAGRERFISLIVEESDRLGRVVNQILLANQLDVGRLDLETEPFDAEELLERVAEAARTHVPSHISLEVVAADDVPPVAADKDRARQILVNLVENAIKYSPDGGRIELGVRATDGMVAFRVLDEGIGIPADEQPRIFEKFYRLDPSMTRGIGGTGLGLYICSELVERMGGRIWVESREPKGSAFLFELPSVGSPRALTRPRETSGAGRPTKNVDRGA